MRTDCFKPSFALVGQRCKRRPEGDQRGGATSVGAPHTFLCSPTSRVHKVGEPKIKVSMPVRSKTSAEPQATLAIEHRTCRRIQKSAWFKPGQQFSATGTGVILGTSSNRTRTYVKRQFTYSKPSHLTQADATDSKFGKRVRFRSFQKTLVERELRLTVVFCSVTNRTPGSSFATTGPTR